MTGRSLHSGILYYSLYTFKALIFLSLRVHCPVILFVGNKRERETERKRERGREREEMEGGSEVIFLVPLVSFWPFLYHGYNLKLIQSLFFDCCLHSNGV